MRNRDRRHVATPEGTLDQKNSRYHRHYNQSEKEEKMQRALRRKTVSVTGIRSIRKEMEREPQCEAHRETTSNAQCTLKSYSPLTYLT